MKGGWLDVVLRPRFHCTAISQWATDCTLVYKVGGLLSTAIGLEAQESSRWLSGKYHSDQCKYFSLRADLASFSFNL